MFACQTLYVTISVRHMRDEKSSMRTWTTFSLQLFLAVVILVKLVKLFALGSQVLLSQCDLSTRQSTLYQKGNEDSI